MLEHHLSVIESTIDHALQVNGVQQTSERLFEIFFNNHPETLAFFKNTNIASFAPRKFEVIRNFLIDIIKHPEYFDGEIADEVMRHTAYGLTHQEYYNNLIDSFHICIREACSEEWNEDKETCWNEIAMGMKSAILEASQVYL